MVQPAQLAVNTIHTKAKNGQLNLAFGIKVIASPTIVQIAQQAGYDSLFIDLEHTTLSVADAGILCTSGLLAGVTPLVRVPLECGIGMVQRVLDAGAMGVIFPHVNTKGEAQTAVAMSKYPPLGRRSLGGQLPQFWCTSTPGTRVIEELNATGSSVVVMIETQEALDNIDEIASVEGVDMLLVGANDFSIELGVTQQFRNDKFRAAMEVVGKACKRHQKVFALAGIYEQPDLHDWAINELGVRWMMTGLDTVWIANGSKASMEAVQKVIK